MRAPSGPLFALAAALCGASPALGVTLERSFLEPSATPGSLFGEAVSMAGSNLLVGAPRANSGAAGAGAAHLYDAGTGVLIRSFSNPAPVILDQFGLAVAVSATHVLIGEPLDDAGDSAAGQAHLYDVSTGNPLRSWANPSPLENERFGNSVALTPSRALVGAPRANTAVVGAGEVHVFVLNTLASERVLTRPGAVRDDRFGSAIATAGELALVGAPQADPGARNSGEALLFDLPTGNVLRNFSNPTPASNDNFGLSLALSTQYALIGAPLDDQGARDAGAAHLFDLTSGNLLFSFLNPTPSTGDQFGLSVALFGDFALIGEPFDDTGGTDAGAVHIFDLAGGELLASLYGPDPAGGIRLGFSVALNDDWAVAGAPQGLTAEGSARAGAVLVWGDATPPGVAPPPPTPAPPVPLPPAAPLLAAGLLALAALRGRQTTRSGRS